MKTVFTESYPHVDPFQASETAEVDREIFDFYISMRVK